MNLKDLIGKRGENLFRVVITEFCDGRPLFDETFLGEKHPRTDFMVELIGRDAGPASFFAEVKATREVVEFYQRQQSTNDQLVEE